MKLLLKLILISLTVFVGAEIIEGVSLATTTDAIVVAVVLFLLTLIVKPILLVLTFPVTLVTLGLFIFVINAIVVIIADALVAGFTVDGFIPALLLSLLVSIVSTVFEHSEKKKR